MNTQEKNPVSMQIVRNRIEAMKAEVNTLEEEREGLSGYEKGRVTRDIITEHIASLEASLGDDPDPINPNVVAKLVREFLLKPRQNYTEAKQAFLDQCLSSDLGPLDAIERRTDQLAGYAVVYQAFNNVGVYNVLDDIDNDVSKLFSLATMAIQAVINDQERSLSHIAGSSNRLANAIEIAQIEKRAQWMRWDQRYFDQELAYLQARYLAYLDLEEACEQDPQVDLATLAPDLVKEVE